MKAPGEGTGLNLFFLLVPMLDALGALPPRASHGAAATFVKLWAQKPCFEVPQDCESARGINGELCVAKSREQTPNSQTSLTSLGENISPLCFISGCSRLLSFLWRSTEFAGGDLGGISPCCALMERHGEPPWAGEVVGCFDAPPMIQWQRISWQQVAGR